MGKTMSELCDEVAKLEWINRALKQQIKFNEFRMVEISGQILEMKEEVADGNDK